MKSKLAMFIAATALFIGVWFVRPVFADSTHYLIYAVPNGGYYRPYLYNCASNASLVNDGDYYKLNRGAEYFIGNNLRFSTPQEAVAYALTKVNELYVTTTNDYVRISKTTPVIITNGINVTATGNNIFTSIEDYEESLQPTWWQKIWNAWDEFCNSRAGMAAATGDWLTYIEEVLFGELWSVQVGEGEDQLVEFYTVSATPTPSPTPTPTQIPVSVNIDPSTGDVTYHYTVIVSGTPIPTSSPVNPNPPAGSGGGGGDGGLSEPVGVEDYYEPDDSLSLPNLRIFQFKLDLPGTETDIGIDSIDNNFVVMNEYLEDNAEAITTVSSFFQVIPSEWFLLLGAIACFPIIAAMIKSLLGG